MASCKGLTPWPAFLLLLGLLGHTDGVNVLREDTKASQEWWAVPLEEPDAASNHVLQEGRLLHDKVEKLGYENHSLLRSSSSMELPLLVSQQAPETSNIGNSDFGAFDLAIWFSLPLDCIDIDQRLMGQNLNLILMELGFGDNSDANFVGDICFDPDAIPATNNINTGKPYGYFWVGKAQCRFCGNQDSDKAMTPGTVEVSAADVLQQQIIDAIMTELFPNYPACTNADTRIVVDVIEIEPSIINVNCEPAGIITVDNHIGTLSKEPAIDIPVGLPCYECNTLNFEQKANGRDFAKGDAVRQGEYWNDGTYGVKIFTNHVDSMNEREKARIFDTNYPGSSASGGFPSLGSPNQACIGGGPGEGIEGGPDEVGKNCERLGNVLIIKEPGASHTTPSVEGGMITFTFKPPVDLSSIGLMNIHEGQTLRTRSRGEAWKTYDFQGLGANSAQRVIIEKSSVVKVQVFLTGPGAVTDLEVCRETC